MTKNGRLVSRRKINPIYRRKTRIPRPMVNFDGQYLNGTHVYFPINTGGTTTTQAHELFFVDGGTISSNALSVFKESIPINLDGIVGKYNEYVYESLTLEWFPAVAPGVADGGSQITIAYVDNPENMVSLNSAVSSSVISQIALTRNMKTFNAWERFSYTVPLTRRLKSFNVNSTGTVATDINAMNRSVQGMVMVGFVSLSASAALGNFRGRYRIKLMGLNYGQST